MMSAAGIAAVECASLYFGFRTSEIACAESFTESGVTEQCVWSAVYQFHAVYLSFVHILFYVLLNCCVQDSMKIVLGNHAGHERDMALYFDWHTYMVIPFPTLLANMLAIVSMQRYLVLFGEYAEFSTYVCDAFWIILRTLAAANVIFNFVLLYWFIQTTHEISVLERVRAMFVGSDRWTFEVSQGEKSEKEKVLEV
ncbi:hypothetical protein HDU84_004053 [Entophlyctis sp. JEL0112]|nr:hypothetical protein HDU84_004053 [Entophlyctis sp. JEL0112]